MENHFCGEQKMNEPLSRREVLMTLAGLVAAGALVTTRKNIGSPLVADALAGSIEDKDLLEAPQFTVGDEWTYEGGGKKWVQRVIDIQPDAIIMRYGGDEVRGYDPKTMNIIFHLQGEKRFKFNDTRGQILNFPMQVGRKWSNIVTTKGGTNILEEFHAQSVERLVTKTGTFRALQISYKSQNQRTLKEISSGSYWYAPEVKAIVKRAEARSIATGNMELVTYQLK